MVPHEKGRHGPYDLVLWALMVPGVFWRGSAFGGVVFYGWGRHVWDLGFRVSSVRVWGLRTGFRVVDLGFRNSVD